MGCSRGGGCCASCGGGTKEPGDSLPGVGQSATAVLAAPSLASPPDSGKGLQPPSTPSAATGAEDVDAAATPRPETVRPPDTASPRLGEPGPTGEPLPPPRPGMSGIDKGGMGGGGDPVDVAQAPCVCICRCSGGEAPDPDAGEGGPAEEPFTDRGNIDEIPILLPGCLFGISFGVPFVPIARLPSVGFLQGSPRSSYIFQPTPPSPGVPPSPSGAIAVPASLTTGPTAGWTGRGDPGMAPVFAAPARPGVPEPFESVPLDPDEDAPRALTPPPHPAMMQVGTEEEVVLEGASLPFGDAGPATLDATQSQWESFVSPPDAHRSGYQPVLRDRGYRAPPAAGTFEFSVDFLPGAGIGGYRLNPFDDGSVRAGLRREATTAAAGPMLAEGAGSWGDDGGLRRELAPPQTQPPGTRSAPTFGRSVAEDIIATVAHSPSAPGDLVRIASPWNADFAKPIPAVEGPLDAILRIGSVAAGLPTPRAVTPAYGGAARSGPNVLDRTLSAGVGASARGGGVFAGVDPAMFHRGRGGGTPYLSKAESGAAYLRYAEADRARTEALDSLNEVSARLKTAQAAQDPAVEATEEATFRREEAGRRLSEAIAAGSNVIPEDAPIRVEARATIADETARMNERDSIASTVKALRLLATLKGFELSEADAEYAAARSDKGTADFAATNGSTLHSPTWESKRLKQRNASLERTLRKWSGGSSDFLPAVTARLALLKSRSARDGAARSSGNLASYARPSSSKESQWSGMESVVSAESITKLEQAEASLKETTDVAARARREADRAKKDADATNPDSDKGKDLRATADSLDKNARGWAEQVAEREQQVRYAREDRERHAQKSHAVRVAAARKAIKAAKQAAKAAKRAAKKAIAAARFGASAEEKAYWSAEAARLAEESAEKNRRADQTTEEVKTPPGPPEQDPGPPLVAPDPDAGSPRRPEDPPPPGDVATEPGEVSVVGEPLPVRPKTCSGRVRCHDKRCKKCPPKRPRCLYCYLAEDPNFKPPGPDAGGGGKKGKGGGDAKSGGGGAPGPVQGPGDGSGAKVVTPDDSAPGIGGKAGTGPTSLEEALRLHEKAIAGKGPDTIAPERGVDAAFLLHEAEILRKGGDPTVEAASVSRTPEEWEQWYHNVKRDDDADMRHRPKAKTGYISTKNPTQTELAPPTNVWYTDEGDKVVFDPDTGVIMYVMPGEEPVYFAMTNTGELTVKFYASTYVIYTCLTDIRQLWRLLRYGGRSLRTLWNWIKEFFKKDQSAGNRSQGGKGGSTSSGGRAPNQPPPPPPPPPPKLPPFEGKTIGEFRGADGSAVALKSGRAGPARSMPKGSSGFDLITKTHVEGHAAALMRQSGLTEATVYINNPAICDSCVRLLPRMLPSGSRLTVVLPNGSSVLFTGR